MPNETSDAKRGITKSGDGDHRGIQVTHKLGYRSLLSDHERTQRRICSVFELRRLHLAFHSRNDPHTELGSEQQLTELTNLSLTSMPRHIRGDFDRKASSTYLRRHHFQSRAGIRTRYVG